MQDLRRGAASSPEPRPLNTAELEVLEVALREVGLAIDLPLQRSTQSDGPNQYRLCRWSIPSSLASLGEFNIVESDAQDSIRYRRPRVNEREAEVTLEMPHQVVHCRLEWNPTFGWRLRH